MRIAAPTATAWRVRTVEGSTPSRRVVVPAAGAALRGRGVRRVGSSSSSKKDKGLLGGLRVMESMPTDAAGSVAALFDAAAKVPASAQRMPRV